MQCMTDVRAATLRRLKLLVYLYDQTGKKEIRALSQWLNVSFPIVLQDIQRLNQGSDLFMIQYDASFCKLFVEKGLSRQQIIESVIGSLSGDDHD